jgi:hypothetical protein
MIRTHDLKSERSTTVFYTPNELTDADLEALRIDLTADELAVLIAEALNIDLELEVADEV